MGNGGVFAADESGAENAPLIKTTASDLQAGVYEVFAFFWANPSSDWQFSAGLSDDKLMLYRIRSSQQALAEQFRTPVNVNSGNAALYRAYLGRKVVGEGGDVDVFIDDGIGAAGQQVWFDGIGYAAVASRIAGDFNADGVVSELDLNGSLGWRTRFGVDLSGDDLLAWQRNLGVTLDESVNGVAAPEPAGIGLYWAGAVLLVVRRSHPLRKVLHPKHRHNGLAHGQ